MSRRFVVEADGGSRGNPGPAGYGALVRDADTGVVLVEVAEAIGVASNNVAEYRGLVAGLGAAVELDGDCTVEVRMDSKLVVEQMSGRWKIKHEDMRRLALEARDVVGDRRVRYTWVPRAQNGAADRLANQAMDDAARGLGWRGSVLGGAAEAVAQFGAGSGVEPAGAAAPDLGEPFALVLLRHGATELSGERRFSGAGGPDPALTPLGREQSVAAAETLVLGEPIRAVVCSPLRRCQESAAIVADRLGLPVRVEDGWRECSFGAWDGLTAVEVARRWPREHREWSSSTAVAPPGGESFDALGRRVLVSRDRLLARYPRARVLVVTHVGPITTVVATALGAAPEVVRRLDAAPASISETRWWADGASSVVSFGETGHLRAAGLALR